MRTADRSLAGQSRTDDIVPVISQPDATLPKGDPCLVLAADVDGVALVHEVRTALAMANQGGDERRTAIPHLVKSSQHRVTACERPGCLAYHGEEIRDELGQRSVVLGQSLDLVGEPGRGAVDLGVQPGWSLGELNVVVEVAGQLQQGVRDPLDPLDLPDGHRRGECLLQVVDRLKQFGPTAMDLSNVLRLSPDLGL